VSRTELLLGERFRGPPGSANGGYACGCGRGTAAAPSSTTARKRPAGSALLDGQGRVLAIARAVWVTIP
jgi:hypothetical protein